MAHRRGGVTVALAAALTVGLTAVAGAHPDHGVGENEMSFVEDFPGEGVAHGKQHDGDEGHLPPVQHNVELVGKAEVTNPSRARATTAGSPMCSPTATTPT